MNISRFFGSALLATSGLLVVLAACSLTGCTQKSKENSASQSGKTAEKKAIPAQESEADAAAIKVALAKLSPEDRKLAEGQKFCVMQTEELLGSMGAPIKLTIKGVPVFVCCNGCKKDAQADPDKTLKTVAELKSKTKADTRGGQ